MEFCPEPPFLQHILVPAKVVRAESFLILETLSWQDTYPAWLYSLALTSLVEEDVTLLWNPEKMLFQGFLIPVSRSRAVPTL